MNVWTLLREEKVKSHQSMGSKWNGHGSSFLGQLPPGSNNWVWLKEQDHILFPVFWSSTVFTRIRAMRAAFIWKLDATKNCYNYGIIIFDINQTELTSFDSDYIRTLVLIQGQHLLTFLSQKLVLIPGRRLLRSGTLFK